MFGWLRRRLVKEHAKVLIQNSCACEILAKGWFSHESDVPLELRKFMLFIENAKLSFDPAHGLSSILVDEQLAINRRLRTLYESGPSLAGERFDAAYMPVMGWDRAIKEFIDDRLSKG